MNSTHTNLKGQLEWARVVYPIATLTWDGVKETARKFKDLEVDNDGFYVLYKDEENEQILVKNEADMLEAINWAASNGELLELIIPNASDNDSDWDVLYVDEHRDSPQVAPVSPKEIAQATLTLDERMLEGGVSQEAVYVMNNVEKPIEGISSPAHAAKYERMQNAGVPNGAIKNMMNVEAAESSIVDLSKYKKMLDSGISQGAVEITMTVDGVDPSSLNSLPKEDILAPLDPVLSSKQVEQEETAEESMVQEMQKVEVEMGELKRKQDELSDKILDEFVSRLMTFATIATADDNKYQRMLNAGVSQGALSVMKNVDQNKTVDISASLDSTQRIFHVLSSKRNIEQISKFIQNEKVQNALVAISNAEIEGNGRGGKTALAKLLVVAKECVELIKEVPDAENIIMDVLNSLRVTTEEEIKEEEEVVVNRVRHPNVHCDACDGDVSRATEAFTKKYRNEGGEILGDRYKSAVKSDFDLCTLCEAKPGNEDARPFLKIVDPTNAPEIILCALPGATQGMMTQIESLDWRNPIAREFGEFIQQKNQHAFRAPPPRVIPEAAPTEVVTAPSAPAPNVAPIVETVSFPQAKFVADVTLADGSVVRPGEVIKKTWRIRNSGDQPWPKGVRIAHVGGDAFGGPIEGVEVPLARAGEAVNVTVPLVMPQQPGRYTSYWRMLTPHPSNSKFGHRFWVTVNVVAPTIPSTRNGVILGEAPRRPSPPAPPSFASAPSVVSGNPVIVGSPATRVPPPPPPRSILEDISPELVETISQLTELGFSDIDKIVRILEEVNGDSSRALDRLLAENQ